MAVTINPALDYSDPLELPNESQLAAGLETHFGSMAESYEAIVQGWVLALELRDGESRSHAHRVTDLTLRLARLMGITGESLVRIRYGALLHDIGKLAIPDRILFKAAALTEHERDVIRKHPHYAYQILSTVAFLEPCLDIPLYHHEKWDGSGYCHGLREEAIPLAARIFAAVDVWDALRSPRPYRLEPWPQERVLDYIREQAGRHFDPQVVELFLAHAAEDRFQRPA